MGGDAGAREGAAVTLLQQIAELAKLAQCTIDTRQNGRIVLRRGKRALTSPLEPMAALQWLRREREGYIGPSRK